jgi:hypothetical protein
VAAKGFRERDDAHRADDPNHRLSPRRKSGEVSVSAHSAGVSGEQSDGDIAMGRGGGHRVNAPRHVLSLDTLGRRVGSIPR